MASLAGIIKRSPAALVQHGPVCSSFNQSPDDLHEAQGCSPVQGCDSIVVVCIEIDAGRRG
jgi:hypothetical protein